MNALSICKRSEARVCRAGCTSPPIAGCGLWMNGEANTWCRIQACDPSSASAEISGERGKRKKNQAAICSHSHIYVCRISEGSLLYLQWSSGPWNIWTMAESQRLSGVHNMCVMVHLLYMCVDVS